MSKQSSARFAGYSGDTTVSVQRLSAVKTDQQVRTSVGMQELDRVLGGGLVAGSVVLIGGDPGIEGDTVNFIGDDGVVEAVNIAPKISSGRHSRRLTSSEVP